MKVSDFDYSLPSERIAQTPVRPRDHSRLLVLNRKTGEIKHRHFFDIGEYTKAGDLLVVNESKVFKARLIGRIEDHEVELFLLRPEGENWLALGKPGKRFDVGATVAFDDGRVCVIRDKNSDGTLLVHFTKPASEIIEWANEHGHIPVPPYVSDEPDSLDEYQTVYAKHVGSVAAPTAGFHFTPELIERLKGQGIRFATVTLHVGLGTFRPMKTELIEEHVMHEEWVLVSDKTRQAIKETKTAGGRVIAVGTTTVRALESGIGEGFTNIFITPGFEFNVIDALITNFHFPKSTLLVLVSAFAGEHHHNPNDGRQMILRSYEEAIREEYRFYSFGDAMFIV